MYIFYEQVSNILHLSLLYIYFHLIDHECVPDQFCAFRTVELKLNKMRLEIANDNWLFLWQSKFSKIFDTEDMYMRDIV